MDVPSPSLSPEDIRAAARRIAPYAIRTPLIENAALNARTGGRILLKAEGFQRTGSFKFRGAYNRICQLKPPTAENGVVAYSSGNHAQGVAHAAELMGIPSVIAMPNDTPAIKQRNTKNHGADVVLFDRDRQDRQVLAEQLAKERQAIIVPPFDDPDIIAGQGTCGLEIIEEAKNRGLEIDALLICHGGGGLAAGIATIVATESPDTMLYGVEPEDFDDLKRSLESGRIEHNERGSGSICDALLSRQPGDLTFPINKHRLAGAFAVSDDNVREAVRYAFDVLKLVVEPGGAVALAAILTGQLSCEGRTVAATLSGSNVDPGLFSEIISS